MTEKLFYKDSYTKEFQARVLSCTECKGSYQAVLTRTAFFPEGGGQSADTGFFYTKDGQEIPVTDVQERDGTVFHYIASPVKEGEEIKGKLDFEERFSKMQQHTGEHIVSGLVNRHFGYHNVGFHLGAEEVTMDYDGVLTQEDLEQIELEANQAVAENIPVVVLYPSEEELKNITYRSKIEIEGQVRIVQIPGYDICACCAPHVKETGSIGLIKIVGAVHYKGGMRVSMLCGFRALSDYRMKERNVVKISNLLSAKQEDTAQAVERLGQEVNRQKEKIKNLQKRYVDLCLEEAGNQAKTDPGKSILLFVEELDAGARRNFVNAAMDMTEGFAGVFVGNDEEGYQYVLGSRTRDIQDAGKKLNACFQGKGGGKPPMIQGSLHGKEQALKEFIQNL
ncbi:MAG TPA: alanyl-tRNA editing protein [Candidatus Blautia avicola]|uniref:Alanyl-tRNA editing protein n=1 Tax=Candidatus Blautia avicola TaxID=2838483 RepID=A0A9D2TW13_9FIRM|nr:alanyl-tRNA editing protein [Candidatus Blautia avicola]